MVVSQVVSQGRILHESHSAVRAQVGPLSGMLAVVNTERFRQGEPLPALVALERPLAGVSPLVLAEGSLRGVGLVAKRAGELLDLGVRPQVDDEVVAHAEARAAVWVVADERPARRVHALAVLLEVVLAAEDLVAVGALDRLVGGVHRALVELEVVGRREALLADGAREELPRLFGRALQRGERRALREQRAGRGGRGLSLVVIDLICIVDDNEIQFRG